MRRYNYIHILFTTITLYICALTSGQAQNNTSNWIDIKAEDGGIFKIDLNSITHLNNGTAEILVISGANVGYQRKDLRRFWFDCRGHFRDVSEQGNTPLINISPRSIVARVGQVACLDAKDTRLEDASRPQPEDTPAQYCKDFTEAACSRIKAAVEAQTKPSYCRPGFAVAGTGLSDEQLRICYVITGEEFRTKEANQKKISEQFLKITLSASRGTLPTITGFTNLPDGAKLLIAIKKPRLPNALELLAAGKAMCEDDCLPATDTTRNMFGATAIVQSRAFTAGPFSWNGKPMQKGTYKVDIFLVSLPGDSDAAMSQRMEKPFASVINIEP